jgi:hypothetical protein
MASAALSGKGHGNDADSGVVVVVVCDGGSVVVVAPGTVEVVDVLVVVVGLEPVAVVTNTAGSAMQRPRPTNVRIARERDARSRYFMPYQSNWSASRTVMTMSRRNSFEVAFARCYAASKAGSKSSGNMVEPSLVPVA